MEGFEWFGIALIVLIPLIVSAIGYGAARANLK
jgi:hypothetical protein